jgi:glycosyltransferase involved in cell wall biosynthesis
LVIVGSGPWEQRLKKIAQSKNLKGICWPGFKQVDELPAYYALASCFVLPSVSEPWGLVVNEAMACGLPVLVSDRCGAAGDLVFPGINGYVFDPFDAAGLARLMQCMSAGELNRKEMGQASKRLVANYTPETWAIALADCIRQTAARKGLTP